VIPRIYVESRLGILKTVFQKGMAEDKAENGSGLGGNCQESSVLWFEQHDVGRGGPITKHKNIQPDIFYRKVRMAVGKST
jgi:hypothetical protein